jgi:hypothetical protein
MKISHWRREAGVLAILEHQHHLAVAVDVHYACCQTGALADGGDIDSRVFRISGLKDYRYWSVNASDGCIPLDGYVEGLWLPNTQYTLSVVWRSGCAQWC